MTDLQQGAPSAPPAGWYADPVRPGATRYWSGTGWTDQVSTPAAEVPAPVVAPIPGFMFDAGPVVEPPPMTFAAPPSAPRETHASQSEWHQSRAKPIQRVGVAPVSTTTRSASSVTARRDDPYDRNWIAGVAIVFAVLSSPGLAARMLWDLPPLTQSIFAGAPIGISLLALARAARHRSGRVLSIIAVVISAATLVAAWIVDPEVVRGIVDSIVGLLPA
ncbi:MAG: DUF2510 domain-containing protein [Rhodoglobus sp.]